MLLNQVVAASQQVAATSKRLEKIAILSALLREARDTEIEIAVSFLSGYLRQGRIGVGWALLRDARPDDAAAAPALTLEEVDGFFERLSTVKGAGSTRERGRLLHELFVRATHAEQEFLSKLIFGELRQGALEGIMLDAIARASEVPLPSIRRAHLMTGDLVAVARTALTSGAAGLAGFGVQLFRPLQPMLAQSAEDVASALSELGVAGLEYKLDGARIQVHKSGDEVRVYSRQLNDVTASVPELVEVVRAAPARELVLDGEAIALRADGTPQPFQVTISRFASKLDVNRLSAEMPLRPFFFDLIHHDGESILDATGADRFARLEQILPGPLLIPRAVTDDPAVADEFLQSARAAGHEGIVAKSIAAPYDAGRRGAGWLKVKFTETLDLVILAAEWGHGRRQGWLSNLHLGARDPVNGGFVMLGKTFKGLTDKMLEWQTQEFLKLEIGRDAHVVHLRPEIVAEIAFDDIQSSPRYPGGVALRFARVKRYRPDKRADQADTIERVHEIYTQRQRL